LTRLGLLGGTFDPPHYGHLAAAQEAAARLPLDRVLFLPARQNPLKRSAPGSSAEDRCAMVVLAIADNPLFELSRLDIDRPSPSYTADLLRALQRVGQHLFFIVGADILPELARWREPDEILRLARLVVVNRPGTAPSDVGALEAVVPGAAERVDLIEMPGLAIASRELRERVRAGLPIRYLTPPSVEHYIAEHGLYDPL
jgi:nicotinate-nucleotide adenylyltransferase